MKKKLISLVSVLSLLFVVSITPAYAAELQNYPLESSISPEEAYASDSFSRSTGTMNSWMGSQSEVFNMSSGSVPYEAKVSEIEVRVSVSSGSSPFYLVIKEPNGAWEQYKITGSTTLNIFDFQGYYVEGTWQVYITDSSYVSTATARMTVNYTY